MKRVLYLLLVASSILPMELDHAKTKRLPERLAQSKSHGIWKEHIKPPSVFVPTKLGEVMLYHSDKGFRVYQNDKKHKIDKIFTDPIVRNATREELHGFLQHGYLVINQTTDGEFRLQANERLVGGGPIFGKIMYWTTKTLCYSVLLAGAGAVVVCGGKIGAGVANGSTPDVNSEVVNGMVQSAEQAGIGYAAATATITQASGEAIFSSTAVTGAIAISGMAATGIIKAGGAPVCAKAAGAAVATGASSTGIVAGIEAISLAVGIFCGFTPTP